ncbi:hypothetical protein AN5024.2 [Aspergillus nidulans FGSC A4]|uniref:Amino acid transporter (Eurofung) n=1 Tax=Emericella nidulans (strain FGSC A4 / ATCC 38163 / CBS 112.46 / NRRL 194 / M139) TaxID=227321 RepID=Q5B356_EMENI|nr:hypothetical protein [Aspergillus nidulans FGSC A4]EAA61102.1 hypothetical protein AN5024.2 [Aspergillus nidulans FGSC A4]CBF76257.1 TPA: conserved hypothetical protein [Aspergillus nidulans FGSC A4]|eukprot:XP_662628.1 hypothetical protein AN5024.2 [Aspergillus nidulans FGSC A4]
METPASSISDTQSPSKKDSPMSRTESVDIEEVALKPGSAEHPSKSDETELSAAIEQAVNHRRLNPRQIQLTAMAGSIGAALFVGIESGVMSGPLCLFLASIFGPLLSSLSHSAVCGYASTLRLTICFMRLEISRLTITTFATSLPRNQRIPSRSFWRSRVFALGKILLAAGLIIYRIGVMLGVNPMNECVRSPVAEANPNTLCSRFGFRYWKEPGLWAGAKPSGMLMSFVDAANVAAFCMGGPDGCLCIGIALASVTGIEWKVLKHAVP